MASDVHSLSDDEARAYAEFQAATRAHAQAEQLIAETQARLQAATRELYKFALTTKET